MAIIFNMQNEVKICIVDWHYAIHVKKINGLVKKSMFCDWICNFRSKHEILYDECDRV